MTLEIWGVAGAILATLFAGVSAVCAYQSVRLSVRASHDQRFLDEHKMALEQMDELISLFSGVCANWLTKGLVEPSTLRKIERRLFVLGSVSLVNDDVAKWKDVFIDRLILQNEMVDGMLPENFEKLCLQRLQPDTTVQVYLQEKVQELNEIKNRRFFRGCG